jgi:small lipoprotein (TIGR04452 family)
MKLKFIIMLLTISFLFGSCAEIGIKPTGSVTGKEARKMIQKGLLLVTLLDSTAASSSDYSTSINGRYELIFDLLNPYMIAIDEDANYSKTEVNKCIASMSKTSLTASSVLASLQCKLKPLSVIGI